MQKEKYLLSYNGQYYEASHAIVELVEELQRYEEEKAAIEAYVRKKEGKYTPEQVREVIEKFIDPIFRAVPKKRSFLYEKELFSAGAIDRFSDTFRFLFHKAYMMVVLVGMLALDTWFFFTTSDLLLFNNKVNIYMVAGLLVFMFASSFFHELGHASACKYFGVRHGGIGFGLYLNFPVLYTDVTEVWKLNRAQRCVVNLAGVANRRGGMFRAKVKCDGAKEVSHAFCLYGEKNTPRVNIFKCEDGRIELGIYTKSGYRCEKIKGIRTIVAPIK